jgi:hypothetical protein
VEKNSAELNTGIAVEIFFSGAGDKAVSEILGGVMFSRNKKRKQTKRRKIN